jgi:hypothetical protein
MDWGSAGQRRLKADTPISPDSWWYWYGMQVMISKDPSSVLVGVGPIR